MVINLQIVSYFINLVQFLHHRLLLMEYGIWDQLCVDHGNEWVLMLFVQEKLAHLRYNISKPPPPSTNNTQTSMFVPSVGYAYICILIHHSPFHVIRDTDPCTECTWAWVFTEAWGYRTYMHSACQFGSLGPGSWVLGPWVLGPRVHWI